MHKVEETVSYHAASQAPVTLAVDAMGGYDAPKVVVEAVAKASTMRFERQPLYCTLVGDESLLTPLLSNMSHNPERINMVHAPSRIGLHEPAQLVYADRTQSSISVACKLVADGYADAVVSAGNPGGAILSARAHFELIEHVSRAALATVYPTPRKRGDKDDPFSLILDVGASNRANAEQLVGYALMGSAYAKMVSHNAFPRVALLSNSKEPYAGPEYVSQAFVLLEQRSDINFMGCIQGHDIPSGHADVIVCEGFVGDVALRILEGVGSAAVELARSAYEHKFVYRQGLRLLAGGLRKIKQLIDFEEYGGAPLLGFNHTMILAHPRSGSKAVENALRLAHKSVRGALAHHITQAVSAPIL